MDAIAPRPEVWSASSRFWTADKMKRPDVEGWSLVSICSPYAWREHCTDLDDTVSNHVSVYVVSAAVTTVVNL